MDAKDKETLSEIKAMAAARIKDIEDESQSKKSGSGSDDDDDEDEEDIINVKQEDLIFNPESGLRNWLKSRGKGEFIDFSDE